MKCLITLFTLFIFQNLIAQNTFHGNIARTGIYEDPGIKQLNGVKWKFKTAGPIISSPAIAYGLVFVGSADNNFYAVDTKSGVLKWKFKTSGKINSPPAVEDSTVYFSSTDGYFYALKAVTGEQVWKFSTGFERHFQAAGLHGLKPRTQIIPDSWDVFNSSPALFNGRVYFGFADGNVYALDTKAGFIRWKFQTEDVVHASPAIADNTVYIGSWDGSFYALDAETGEQKWRFKGGIDPINYNHIGFQSSATVVNGIVYVGCRDAHVYAIYASTGKKKWEYSTKTTWASASPIVKSGIVYINANRLLALDAETGHLIFTCKEPPVWGISSPIFASDQIFTGGFNGRLYSLNAKTGEKNWDFKTEGAQNDVLHVLNADGSWSKLAFAETFYDFEDDYIDMYKRFTAGAILSTPVIQNGEIYFGSTDGYLYVLR